MTATTTAAASMSSEEIYIAALRRGDAKARIETTALLGARQAGEDMALVRSMLKLLGIIKDQNAKELKAQHQRAVKKLTERRAAILKAQEDVSELVAEVNHASNAIAVLTQHRESVIYHAQHHPICGKACLPEIRAAKLDIDREWAR